ncbi:hypothetical protein FRC02_007418 [Tulasnella sp. 418]|nr:hypothetical protein FRC02_007418 [Tulasnella sp. 418]
MAKDHEYCCCAIPLLNVGIYITLLEQFTVGLLGGILAIATPKIVGASVPGFGAWLFAIPCFLAAGLQALGFFGVFKENATLFQRFARVNAIVISLIFGVGATWIIISATRHQPATDKCVNTFFAETPADETSAIASGGQGDTICSIFTWVDIGIMAGLWVVMAIFQGYLILVCHWYSVSQRADHSKYYSIYSVNAPESEGYDLGARRPGDDAWDPRPSTDSWSGNAFSGNAAARYSDHARQPSDATEKGYGVSATHIENAMKPSYGYQDDGRMGYTDRKGYYDDDSPQDVHQPGQAYTNEPSATPTQYYAAHHQLPNDGLPAPGGAMYADQPRVYASSSAPTYQTEQTHPPYYSQR